jgi:hypothetical protein
MASSGSATELIMSGNVTLSGTGNVTMSVSSCALRKLGNSVIHHSRRATQNCVILQQKLSRPLKTLIVLISTTLLALPTFSQEGKTDASSAIRQAEERWEAAIMKRESKTVGELVASDYAGVNEKGRDEDKAALLSRMHKETETLTSAKITDLKVRTYAPERGSRDRRYRGERH